LKSRFRTKTNASIISIFQRFSDISIMIITLYSLCVINHLEFSYKYVFIFLAVLVIFQMIGGITDFYRSWRGVKLSAEMALVIKNWTLSILLTMGIVSFTPEIIIPFKIMLWWYISSFLGILLCRTLIRYGARWVRLLGYNTRKVAIAGSMPVGISLAKSFIEEPWLGFVVNGYYDDVNKNESAIPYIGNYDILLNDAKAGKIDR
ncbi:TPA: undecaprenyl-phosphate glucose phosphotransferase, partial [Escherichia coli]